MITTVITSDKVGEMDYMLLRVLYMCVYSCD